MISMVDQIRQLNPAIWGIKTRRNKTENGYLPKEPKSMMDQIRQLNPVIWGIKTRRM